MKELDITPEDRRVVVPARETALASQKRPDKGNKNVHCGAAVELPDGTIVTGVNSPLLHAASAVTLNALKRLAGLPPKLRLLSPAIITSISHLKQDILRRKSVSLDLEETLIALSIASTSNPTAEMAMAQIGKLRGCEMHLTHIPASGDETGLRRLGVNLTADPHFATSDLFAD
jgi:uncharacterized protein (UPF0371 family)